MKFFLIFLFSISLFAAKYSICFLGNKTFDNKTLYKKLGFEQSIWDKIFFKKFEPHADEKLLSTLKEELELFYKQEGFWNIKIELKIDNKEKKAIFFIFEDKPIIIKKIEITSDFPIKEYISLKENMRFSTKKFIKSKEDIKHALLKKGYCSFTFNPKAYLYTKNYEAYLVYFLEKGNICKIKSIKISGNKTIHKDVILSHIYINEGEYLSLEKIEESYKRLYALEYFNSVRFDYSKKINNNILMDLNIKERKKKNIYKAGLGYESLSGPHISLYWKNINIKEKQLEIETFYSKNKKILSTKLFIPTINLFSNSYDFVTKASYLDEVYESFSQKSTLLEGSLIKEYYKFSYKIGLFFENSKIYSEDDCENSATFNLLYPSLGFMIDKRDSKLFPTRGFYAKSDIEGSLKAFSNASYIKNLNEIGLYFSFYKIILFLRGKIGFIDLEKGEIPPSKLFFSGGINSNRAYVYNRLSAVDSECKSGGKSLFETTVEIEFPFFKKSNLAIFWDRTVLSIKKFNFISKPVNGIGVGLRYPTPIGNLRVDFGADTKDLKQNALHLSIGASF